MQGTSPWGFHKTASSTASWGGGSCQESGSGERVNQPDTDRGSPWQLKKGRKAKPHLIMVGGLSHRSLANVQSSQPPFVHWMISSTEVKAVTYISSQLSWIWFKKTQPRLSSSLCSRASECVLRQKSMDLDQICLCSPWACVPPHARTVCGVVFSLHS